jgi:peptidoglycan/LPS O-acetylase OafA/YrhL
VVRYFSAAQIKRIAMLVILASPLLRLFLVGHHVNIYSNFFCRLDGLMAGALLAVVLRTKTFEPARYVKLASFLIAACLAILADNHQVRWIAFSMTSLASVSLVYVALFSLGKWVQWFFRNRFLTYTGIIGYGLYLLHKIPLDVAKEVHADRRSFLSIFMILASSYLLAAISYVLLEKPFLKLKRFFDLRAAARS